MSRAVIQANIQTANGAVSVAPGASVSITLSATGAPATLYAAREGGSPITNPTTADSNGFFRVYVDSGRYTITATLGSSVQTFQDVAVFADGVALGTAASLSAEQVTQQTSVTGSAMLPSGTDAQRDGTPAAGYIRHNTTSGILETFLTAWRKIFTSVDADTAAAADKLAMRTATGTLKAADGVDADDVATMDQIVSRDYVDGTVTITPDADGNYTLTAAEALYGRLELVDGEWTQGWAIIVPDDEKMRVIDNSAGTYTATVKTALGTGVVVLSGQESSTYCDGTDVVYAARKEFNASGDAPVYACRAWVNFDGTGTVAIRASGNVSSITHNGAGDYTINFATAMPDADYAVCVSAGTATANGRIVNPVKSAPSTSAARILAATGAFTGFDSDYVYVSFFR
jgi:hypothetical protein